MDNKYLANIISHIPTHTIKLEATEDGDLWCDEFCFYRKGSLNGYSNENIRLGVNYQFSIKNEGYSQFGSNNIWSKDCDYYLKQENFYNRFFEYSDKVDENKIYFYTKCLQRCNVDVIYDNGDVVKFNGSIDDIKEKHEIQLYKNNTIKSIILTDVTPEFETIKFEYFLNSCYTKCQYRKGETIGSFSCTQYCPNSSYNKSIKVDEHHCNYKFINK